MAAAYPTQVATNVPQRKKHAYKAPKPPKTRPPKTKKPPKNPRHNTPIPNPTTGPVLPSGSTSTPTATPNTDFSTLADLYREIFGPQIGFAPDTSQSGESVLVVPGDDSTDSGSNKGMIILIVLVLAGGGYYLYKRSKKAA